MKGLDTITLNNAFEQAQYLETIFCRDQDVKGHAYSRTEWLTEQ